MLDLGMGLPGVKDRAASIGIPWLLWISLISLLTSDPNLRNLTPPPVTSDTCLASTSEMATKLMPQEMNVGGHPAPYSEEATVWARFHLQYRGAPRDVAGRPATSL